MADSIHVVFNHFPEIEAAMREALSEIIRKAALDCEADAKDRAPVQTGFLRNSIYSVTHEGSDYGQGGGGAMPKDATLLPEIAPAEDALTAYVAVGANYGAFVELGTSRMRAQPYLIPAAEAIKPALSEAVSHLEAAMKEKAGL